MFYRLLLSVIRERVSWDGPWVKRDLNSLEYIGTISQFDSSVTIESLHVGELLDNYNMPSIDTEGLFPIRYCNKSEKAAAH